MALLFATVACGISSTLHAQHTKGFLARLADSVSYRGEAVVTASDASGKTPFWLTSNRYGLAGAKHSNGHISFGISRDTKSDAGQKWRFGYGAQIAVAHNYTSDFILQQLYAEVAHRGWALSLGAKEREMNFKNPELSTGSQTFGINARPIPELRFDIPEYISISGKKRIVSIRGHIGYGMLTDGNWQQSVVGKRHSSYVKHTLYHSKSGFLKIGNKDLFPLTFEAGLEMGATFGGKYYRDGKSENLYQGIQDFAQIFFCSSYDPGEVEHKNAKGNTLGSWLMNLTYYADNWKLRAYYDHYFEDHSGLFYSNGAYDGMYGIELNLPANPWVDDIVYEHVYTKFQSGACYHDPTANLKDKAFGIDNYYNHGIYSGWQHWGMAVGNPLYLSPIYNDDKTLTFKSNRFSAHHVGISGNPSPHFHYRMLYSFAKHYGTYSTPYEDVKIQRSFMAQVDFKPKNLFGAKFRNWSIAAAFAADHGRQTGNNSGFQFTLKKWGNF